MLFSKFILTAASASAVLAAPAHHQHNQHKREVVVHTVVVQKEVAAAEAVSPTPVPATNNNNNNENTQKETQPETKQENNSDSSSDSSSDSGSDSSSDSSSGKNIGKAVTYSPYAADGQCKDLATVKSDLSKLSDYQTIRLYGVDCTQVENVLQAKAKNQKLFLGLFFMDQITPGVKQMSEAVAKYGSWNDVHTVSVGNELVNNGAATVDQISSYVTTARTALRAAGYNGPVVSVDTHVATLANPGLCSISDYVAFNAHAYFDQNTEASGTGEWLKEQIERVKTACGNQNVVVTETGWPHQGSDNGKAVASKEAQQAAIDSIKAHHTDNVILFNAYDDLWKADGNLGCEKYWGIS